MKPSIPRKIKVGWILLGNQNTGSSRIHAINIHKSLNKDKFQSTIIKSPSPAETSLKINLKEKLCILLARFDILIFQKVYDKDAQILAKIASILRTKTVFLQSDLVETNMTTSVDHVVVCSNYLKETLKLRHPGSSKKYTVIDDAIEPSSNHTKQHLLKTGVNLVWVGHSDNWNTLDVVKEALKKLNDKTINLRTISNHTDATYSWDINTVYELILQNDVAVIPSTNNDWSKSKSTNRLTLFMSAGLPVIAWPIPSYNELIKKSKAGLLAETTEEWCTAILKLKDHKIRKQISEKGRAYAENNYSNKVITSQWEEFFEKTVSHNTHKN
ncbi:MAG: glycosyltransferase family 4 protein [Porticoccaceae bacterium]|nr:glycosyltransferase family 4 protein [Porticoccaceae bacterium]